MTTPDRGGRVLIVDDDPEIRLVLSRMLQSEGYEIFHARDGEEGLAQADAEQPDVILLDVVMPKLGGFEVCRRLKAMEEVGLKILGEEVNRGWWDPEVFAEFCLLVESGFGEAGEGRSTPLEVPED